MTEIPVPKKEAVKKTSDSSLAKTLKAIIGGLVIAAVIIMVVETSVQKVEPKDHLAQEVKIDPEINILAQYMKARNSKMPVELAEMMAQLIISVAKAEGLPVELLVGMIESESRFDPFSVSGVGAAGLMQILLEDGVVIDDNQKFDIKYNLEKGCEILHSKLEKLDGHLQKSLAAYSGNAEGYADRVYTGVGRYTLYRSRKNDSKILIVKGDTNETDKRN